MACTTAAPYRFVPDFLALPQTFTSVHDFALVHHGYTLREILDSVNVRPHGYIFVFFIMKNVFFC